MALTRIKTDQIFDGTITGSDIASGTDIASNNLTLTGDLRGPSIFTIDPAAIGDNTGTVVIAGDLQVDGSTTTINSSTLTVDDKQIVIASGATDNTSADGAGILIDGANATITYDGTNDRFEINKDVNVSGGLDVDSGTLFVDSTNNRVGVGTSSPNRALHVTGTIQADTTDGVSGEYTTIAYRFIEGRGWGYNKVDDQIFYNAAGGEIPFIIGRNDLIFQPNNNKAIHAFNSGNVAFYEDTGTTPKFFWDASAERLGIGTSSPNAAFEAKDQSSVSIDVSDPDFPFIGNNFSSADTLVLGSLGALSIRVDTNNNDSDGNEIIDFQVGGSEAARINSSGNLLVGTTDNFPANTGDVGVALRNTSGNASPIVAGSQDNPVAFMNRNGSDGVIVQFRKDGSTVGSIGSVGGNELYVGSGTDFLKFGFNSVDPATSSGANNDNELDLGKNSSRFKDLYLSGGVYLGGTGSANKLDDYEEGTWTPTYLGSTSNPTITYSSNTFGEYNKIGNIVICRGTLRTDSVSGGSGNLGIGGLPFPTTDSPDNETGYSMVNVFAAVSGTFAGEYPISGQTFPDSSTASLTYRSTLDGATQSSQVSDLLDGSNNNFIKFMIIYRTS